MINIIMFKLSIFLIVCSIPLALLIVLIIDYLKEFLLGLWDERIYIVYQTKEFIRGIHELTLKRIKWEKEETK